VDFPGHAIRRIPYTAAVGTAQCGQLSSWASVHILVLSKLLERAAGDQIQLFLDTLVIAMPSASLEMLMIDRQCTHITHVLVSRLHSTRSRNTDDWFVGWSLTSLISTNTAISETINTDEFSY